MIETLLFATGLLVGVIITYLLVKNKEDAMKSENIKLKTELKSELNSNEKLENLAARVMASQSDKNRDELEKTLNPLRQNLDSFKNRLEDLTSKNAEDRSALKQHISNLQESNSALSEQAENLTKALRSDKKLQGDWGEVILEKILQQSGLEKGREYVIQESFKNNEGKSFRPDVIVKLPDDKNVIIDAKVSLNAYTEYSAEEDEEIKKLLIKKHITAIDKHIEMLSSKNYEQLEGIRSLDYTLLFFSLEAAFLAALKEDPQLFERGIAKHIILVTPSTLLATLKVIHNIWRNEARVRNAQEIALEGGRLYDKFHDFVEDIKKVDDSLHKVQNNLDKAKDKLYRGGGNLESRAHKMQKLVQKAASAGDIIMGKDSSSIVDKVEKIKRLGANAKKQLSVPE